MGRWRGRGTSGVGGGQRRLSLAATSIFHCSSRSSRWKVRSFGTLRDGTSIEWRFRQVKRPRSCWYRSRVRGCCWRWAYYRG